MLGFEDEDLGSSPGWWAATVASYCLNRLVELPKCLSSKPSERRDAQQCTYQVRTDERKGRQSGIFQWTYELENSVDGRSLSSFSLRRVRPRPCSTACGHRMAHRKWKETKQQPGTAGPGNMLGWCLVSFHFLWSILCPQAVDRAS